MISSVVVGYTLKPEHMGEHVPLIEAIRKQLSSEQGSGVQ